MIKMEDLNTIMKQLKQNRGRLKTALAHPNTPSVRELKDWQMDQHGSICTCEKCEAMLGWDEWGLDDDE